MTDMLINNQTDLQLLHPRGSVWHRWEPHIHTPGTVLNDQFTGPDAWERYLTKIEDATPTIRALGVTDYYSTNTYERVLKARASSRLKNCDLIFANVEMRLAVGTVKGHWANLHLLVSPEDPNHLEELWRFLNRLTFSAHQDSFNCAAGDLIRLGQKADPNLAGQAALEKGATQFKISFPELVTQYSASAWAKANIVVAVAGGETDGTSGIREAADATLRQEIEKFAHVIFASSPSQRDFWLGRKSASVDIVRSRYGGLKPCLHGSDGHDHQSAGTPDGDRYSWIKGAVAFDSLRQAVIDPAGRAFVGPSPPFRASPSQVISSVNVTGAEWLQAPTIELNPGLVAIIGARGSGKTALADAIAAGCDATSGRLSDASFLVRARDLLSGVSVRLDWENAGASERSLIEERTDSSRYPRARYLSQRFVETLCSATGPTDELIHEIERVIFEAHPANARDGAVDFDELLLLRASRLRQMREREEDAIATLSDRIGVEREKETQVGGLRSDVKRKEDLISGYIKDRDKLLSKGSGDRVARLGALTAAAEKVRGHLRYFTEQEQALLSLQDDVAAFRRYRAPEQLRLAKQTFKATELTDDQWDPFLLRHSGDVDTTLTDQLKRSRDAAGTWRGKAPPVAANANTPLIPADEELERLPLAVLDAEIDRLQKQINVDNDTAKRYVAISRRIVEETAALGRLTTTLKDCENAHARAKDLYLEREAAYLRVFEAICAEEALLRELYAPLMERLEAASGTLRKLSFSVSRHVDVKAWAALGEGLFDLRRQGPFKGRGTLEQWAQATLKEAWEKGTAETVAHAMAAFREQNQSELLDLANVPRAEQADYRSWLMRFAKWLFGTAHIEIRYSIDYEGVDIRKLSPGTRGIVLLLLYLALDDADDRPLIIDQPEENLDPKSVFDELVELFVAAKDKRQIVLVTHNANLVINTDADQVIVASAGTHAPGELPPISYLCGGLESAPIRRLVCEILEGGEEAFKERARRLRVRLDR
jgi:energy-coupling factor transporter ATP-binding protein EcfA2